MASFFSLFGILDVLLLIMETSFLEVVVWTVLHLSGITKDHEEQENHNCEYTERHMHDLLALLKTACRCIS